MLLGFGVLAVSARVAGAEALGAYLSVVSMATLVPRLLDCGLPLAVGYFLRLRPAGLRACCRVLGRHVVVAAPAAVLLAQALMWFPFEGPLASALAATHWPQVGALIVADLVMLLGLAAFIPTTRYKAYLATVVLPPGLMLIGLGAHTLARPGRPLDAGSLLNLLTAASVIAGAVMILALRRAARQARTNEPTMAAGPVYRYGLRTYGAAVAKILAQRFDRVYLVTVLGSAGYAHYSLAGSIRDMVSFPANLFALTLRNRQIDLIGHHCNLPAARRLLLRVSLVWSLAGIVLAAALAPMWNAIVTFGFGRAMLPTAHFVEILVFSCAPMAVMSFAWNHLYALNRPGRVTVLTTASLALAIPTYAICIALAGASDGVAWATVAWATASAIASLGWALLSKPPAPTPPPSASSA